jgi:xanthine dehydrogenase YagS FAD-binding subunit
VTPFTYSRASTPTDAVRQGLQLNAKYLGGGTNLVDLMRETLEKPAALIDVTGLSDIVAEQDNGGVIIGAAARNTALAENILIRTRFPMLSRAILAGASAQIRNMATVGGNLLQRTRCAYFYDDNGSRCNKRTPGQGCDAIEGFNRMHAILGSSADCVAVHPSDMCVALAALDSLVHISSADGERAIPFAELHRLPGDRPQEDTTLKSGDLITAIELPAYASQGRSTYSKVRDRSSYAFALVSVAACLELDGGSVKAVRVALGGVAHKPWRATQLEQHLHGRAATLENFRAAADEELAQAKPLSQNGFKVELAKRTIVAVLAELSGVKS